MVLGCFDERSHKQGAHPSVPWLGRENPAGSSRVAYSNTASKLIFQTADPDLKVSKFLASKSTNYSDPDEIRQIIASLQQGNAFFITQNRGHSIRVSDFPKRATQWRE